MLADLTFAARTLRRTPGLTAVALLCLACAIGVTTAAFNVLQDAFLSPLKVPNGDRLVMVHDFSRAGRFNVPATAAQFTHRREHAASFEALGAWYSRNVALSSERGDERGLARAAYVSPNALSILGIAPSPGRYPSEADVAPGAAAVVLLGHDVWQRRFGGDGRILGRTIRIAGTPHQVIGIMPPGVRFPVRE